MCKHGTLVARLMENLVRHIFFVYIVSSITIVILILIDPLVVSRCF